MNGRRCFEYCGDNRCTCEARGPLLGDITTLAPSSEPRWPCQSAGKTGSGHRVLFEVATNEEERKALDLLLNLPPRDLMCFADQALLALMRIERSTNTDSMRYAASAVLDRFEVRRES